MKLTKFAAVAVVASLVAACSDTGPKQGVGTLIGAGVGGLAGSQIGGGRGALAATAVGALLGALVGSEAGKSLDRADMAYLNRTQSQALEGTPSGTVSSWRNPDSGNYGTVTPQPAYQTAGGQYCREFQQTVTVGGKTESAFGTACRQPDGSWKVAN